MRRNPETGRIEFDADDSEVRAEFVKTAAENHGSEIVCRNLLRAIGDSTRDNDEAWSEIMRRTRAASLIPDGSRLVYYYGTGDFGEITVPDQGPLVRLLRAAKGHAEREGRSALAALLDEEMKRVWPQEKKRPAAEAQEKAESETDGGS